MSRRWSSQLRATLGANGAVVRVLERDRRAEWKEVARAESTCCAEPADLNEVVAVLDRVLADLAEAGRVLRGVRCDVAVEDRWVVYELIEGELDAHPRRAADALASAVVADTAMSDPDALTVRWQRQGRARTLACALPSNALATLAAILQRHGIRVGSIRGEFVTRCNEADIAAISGTAVLALSRPRGTQLGIVLDGRLAALSYEPGVRDSHGAMERGRALMRTAGHEFDEGTRLIEGGRERSAPRLESRARFSSLLRSLRGTALDLDFARAHASAQPRSWALLGVGALALVIALLQFESVSREHRQEAHRLEALEAALGEFEAAPTARPSADEARRERKAVAVARELQVPWARLFAAIENVGNRNVALLAVEPSPQRREVRFVAEAKTSDDMFDFLDALQVQPLAEVALVSHQVQAQSPGAPVRFHARALWSTP